MADETAKLVVALIPAAGRGVRFGSSENKVFAPLLGRPLLGWTLRAFADCDAIDAVILIGSADDLPRLREIGERYGGGKVTSVVLGGDTRQESVRLGLNAVPDSATIVTVHDAARCCVTPEIIAVTVASAREPHGGVTAAYPVADSLMREDRLQDLVDNADIAWVGEYIDRTVLWQVQTPQTFNAAKLRDAHRFAKEEGVRTTDDAALFQRYFFHVAIASSSGENLKVTRPEDLGLAEAILARRLSLLFAPSPAPTPAPLSPSPFPPADEEKGEPEKTGAEPFGVPESSTTVGLLNSPSSPSAGGKGLGDRGAGDGYAFRVGHGYDVHQLVSGRELWLGGVHFPESPLGLLGHSDADALLHAVCDALLGAAGMGDIGVLFPPSDMAHKDRRSIEFLAEVKTRLDNAGWHVGNVDVTVLAETPKIAPRAGTIRETIAVHLGISADAVSVKATTNEKMGFVGRGEGIAVHATALLYR